MNFAEATNAVLRKWLVLILLAVPAVVWAQEKNEKKENAPPQASKPAPPPQHPAAAPANRAPSSATGQQPTTTTTDRGTPTTRTGRETPTTPTGRGTPATTTGRGTPATTTGRGTPTTTTTTGREAPATSTRTVAPHPPSQVIKGHTVTYRSGGRVETIRTPRGTTIYRGPYGGRVVVREYGGRRLVSVGPHRGYVERPYRRDRFGREYRVRTYYWGGRPYAVIYRTYYWGGRPYYWYVPAYYYRPVYYYWVYNPWAVPVYYRWGWFGDPWYAYYGYYFAPYPVYSSASLWLTDFILAENLRMAYEARQNALAAETPPAPAPSAAQLSPEVKQLIAEQVRQQLAAEREVAAAPPGPRAPEAANLAPPALDPKQRVFIVASNLYVSADDGRECALTPGDIILRTGDTLVDGSKVGVSVQSSKKGDCPAGANAQVEVADLQEMHNRFREQVDNGLKQLADNQGKNGLPAAPDTSTSAAADVPTPEPDRDAQTQLQDLQNEADKADADVGQQPPPGRTGGGN